MAQSDATTDRLDALALEFIECFRRGEQPTAHDFAERHPDLADRILDLFPTIAAMEQLRDVKDEASDEQHPPLTLKRLGDLQLVREIGRGGMGIVYEAVQESLDRNVAVKVLPAQMLLEETRLTRFKREARIAAKLHHTNIVPILGVGEDNGHHFYLMQLIDGVGLDLVISSLADRAQTEIVTNEISSNSANGQPDGLAKTDSQFRSAVDDETSVRRESDGDLYTGLLSPVEVAELTAQVADALQYAHEHGVLHRDIKPANLILDASGVLWIADFGLSKGLEGEAVTQTGDVLGTLRYMAPEQFLGQADQRSDIYSLGLTIYELLTRQPAHDDRLRRQAFVKGEPAPLPTRPSEIEPSIPRDLETVILKAIAPEPSDRYATAGELADDLRCVVADRPIRARRASYIHQVWRWCRRNRALASSLLVATISLVLVAVVSTLKYYATQRLNAQISDTLRDEQIQRQKAETTSAIAWDALDEIFVRFSPRRVAPGGATIESDDPALSVRPAVSSETAALLEHLLKYYNRLADEGDNSVDYRRRIAEAHRRIADIYHRLGDYSLAKASYQRTLSLYDDIALSAGLASAEISDRVAIAAVTNELASIHRALDDRTTEFELRETAFQQLANVLMEDRDSESSAVLELARTLYLHGRVDRELSGRPVQGSRSKHRLEWPSGLDAPATAESATWPATFDGPLALQAAIELLEQSTDPEARYLLACCYKDAAIRKGQATDRIFIARSQEILQQLVEEFPSVPDYRFALCLTWTTTEFRRNDSSTGELSDLTTHLESTVRHSEELVQQQPNELAYQLLQASVALKLAMLPLHPRNPNESRRRYETATRLHNKLVSRFPDSVPCQLAQITCRNSFARHLSRNGNSDDAKSLLRDTIELLEELRQAGIPERLLTKPHLDATRVLNTAPRN